MRRVGVLVHPTRPVHEALDTLRAWAADHNLELVQVEPLDSQPKVAPTGEVSACDLVVAMGGDGTVLKALHAAAPTSTPVLGVAYGSLGALSVVSGDELQDALERYASGDWLARRLAALTTVAMPDGPHEHAINDIVVVRRGATQLIVEITVDDDLYVRTAGDGVILATAVGSSAYSMAAGGPLVVAGCPAFVCTPLAMHGGCAPPLLVTADRSVTLQVAPGYGGFEVELDGQRVESAGTRFVIRHERDYATLVERASSDTGLPGLRRRGLIADSPRVLARDRRG